jgi:hypothetical protein
VLEEAGVLGRHDRLLHHRRDLRQCDVVPVLVVERGDQRLAVGGVDPAALRVRRRQQLRRQRHVVRVGPVRARGQHQAGGDGGDRRDGRDQQQRAGQPAQGGPAVARHLKILPAERFRLTDKSVSPAPGRTLGFVTDP